MTEFRQLSEQEELELIEKVDIRLVLANTDDILQRNLDIFFPALLLKLASPYAAARQAVFNSIKNVMSRFNSLSSVKLPVEKLLKQAKRPQIQGDQDGTSVRLYSLLFASKGIDRMSQDDKRLLIPEAVDGISLLPPSLAARMFHILCKLLLSWDSSIEQFQQPNKVREFLNIKNGKDVEFLLEKFTQFFLLIPIKSESNSGVIPRGYSCPGLSVDQVEFFTYHAGVTFTKEQVLKYKNAISQFAASGFVDEDQLLVKLYLVASSDDSNLSERAATMLKRLQIPREDEHFIDFLIGLYVGDRNTGAPPVKALLQEKILAILNGSIIATQNPRNVSVICSIGLNSSSYKLRSLCLLFVQHVSKHNYDSLRANNLSEYSINIAALIRNNLHAEGWPRLQLNSSVPNFSLGIEQRRRQYETLGQILKKDFSLVSDFSFVEFLMDSLKGDLSEFRSAIQEALSSLTPHLPNLSPSSKFKVKKLVRQVMSDNYEIINGDKDTKESIMCMRYIAVKFTNATFEFDDVESRLFNIMGTVATNRYDVVEESFKGLHPYWFRLNQASNTKDFQSKNNYISSGDKETKFPCFATFVEQLLEELHNCQKVDTAIFKLCLNTAVKFSLQTFISQATYGKNTVVVQDENWSLRIENSVEVDEQVLKEVEQELNGLDQKLFFRFIELLVNEFIQRDKKNEKLALSMTHDEIFGHVLLFFIKHSTDEVLSQMSTFIPGIYNFLLSHKTSSELDIKNAANILGLIASCSEDTSEMSQIINSIDLTPNSDVIIPSLYACGYLMPRLYLRRPQDVSSNEVFIAFPTQLIGFIREQKYRVPALRALCQVLKFGTPNLLPKELRKSLVFELISILRSRLMVDQLAVIAWSYLSFYASEFDIFETLYDGLLETHTTKQVDLLFTVGEGLTILADGWGSKFLSLHNHVDKNKLLSLAAEFGNVHLENVLLKLLSICNSVKPSLRKAACIWLLSFVQYLGHEATIVAHSKEIHISFMRFLADRDEFVQDSASRGLSLIYERSGKDLQEDMVKSLLRSFTDSKSAMTMSAGTVSQDTELFEPGMLNTGDGSISTYKDIMNLASEVGDPSLVYKFLSLSRSSTLWSSRKGIAFGLGAILSKTSLEEILKDNNLTSHLLIPKLYRYRFDPYQGVSSAMNDIWISLVKNPSGTVNKYFHEILQELLKGMGNKDWRVREASANAMSELLETVSQEKFNGQLEIIWTMAFRSMDDIKESVRKAGTRLTRILAGILMRSMNENGTNSGKSKDVLEVLLPFLMGPKGLNSDSDDVRQFALRTLISVIKSSSPAIRPFVPTLVYELTLLLSALEPQVINYLTLNADKYNVSTSDIDAQRTQGVHDSPIMRSIETMIETCDDTLIDELVENIIRSIKKSVGLPSKVGSARLLCLLVIQHSASLGRHNSRLLKICFSSLNDRNDAVATSFANAFGYLCKFSKTEKLVKYSHKLVDKYFTSQDDTSKVVVGIAIDSMLKRAPSEFENVASILMPFMFVAKNTESQKLDVFTKLWNEASTSGAGTVKLYLQEITELVSKHIKSSTFAVRLSCARSICQVCAILDVNTGEKEVLQLFNILIEASNGRSWDGKEMVIEALVSLAVLFKNLYKNNTELRTSTEGVLSKEISRNNQAYVKKVIFSQAKYLKAFPSLNLYSELVLVGRQLLEKIDNGGIDHDSDDEGTVANKKAKTTSDLTKKSSKENVSNEEFKIALLKKYAEAFSIVEGGTFPVDLLDFIVSSTLGLFNLGNVIFTWRSQIAISDIGSLLLENIPPESHYTVRDKLSDLWRKSYQEGSASEAIENVQIHLIRFGKKLKEKFSSLRTTVDSDLADLMDFDRSPIVIVELRNAGISL